MAIPVFTFRGKTSYELGYNYGKTLKSRIERTFEIYMALFLQFGSHEFVKSYAMNVKRVIEKCFPKTIANEIKGISDGSGIEIWKIYAINARTEIVCDLGSMTDECTAVVYKKGNIIAQNWDWIDCMQDQIVLVRFILSDINEYKNDDYKTDAILSLIEPGMIGKIGLNSDKIGTLLTLLRKPNDYLKELELDNVRYSGIPIHFLLRLILECNNIDYVCNKLFNSIPINTSSCIGISNANNKAYFLEFCGNKVNKLITSNNGLSFHTNHYIGCDLGLLDMEHYNSSTFNRLQTAKELGLSFKPNMDTNDAIQYIKLILMNKDDDKYPICRYREYFDKLKSHISTNSSIIMDLNKCQIYITKGNGLTSDYYTFNIYKKAKL